MHEIRAEIDINAPKDEVWDIWVGFEKWGEWNPVVNKANGKRAVGECVNITLANPDGSDGPSNSPIIADYVRPDLFRWNVVVGSAESFSNDKILQLTATDSGTHLIHTETFNGELSLIHI